MKIFCIYSFAILAAVASLSGCATSAAPKVPPYDYSAFHKAKPATLLVMPPVNESPDIKATSSVWAHATRPLAEAGYYVLPITLVDETFRQNGIASANDAQDIPFTKLHEYFGADAAVYIRIKSYGTSYLIIASQTGVAVEARIVDLRSGALLWEGTAVASSAEDSQWASPHQQGDFAKLLAAAAMKQIADTASDAAYKYAKIADERLLGAPRPRGVPPGPRSRFYAQPPTAN